MLGIFFFNEFKSFLYFLNKLISIYFWIAFFIENIDQKNKWISGQIIKFGIYDVFDQGWWELSILKELWPNHLWNELIEFFQNLKNLCLETFVFVFVNKHLNQAINKWKLRIWNALKPCDQLSLHFWCGTFFFVFHDATVQLLNLLFHIFFFSFF